MVMLLVFTCTIATGQKSLVIGISGGIGSSTMKGSFYSAGKTEPSLGYTCMLSVQYPLTKHVSMYTGLGFDRKGVLSKIPASYPVGSNFELDKTLSKFNYLTIPMLFRFSTGEKFTCFISGGPYIGFLLSETDKIMNWGQPVRKIKYTSNFSALDIGLSLGIGAAIPLCKNYSLTCEVRNNTGILDLNRGPGVNTGVLRSQSLNLLLGISYSIKRKD
ncbi:MAG: PorT family protein [Bacteroidia bacterium]|nr:PorT family protein [Bacteroidia bacterium]